MGLYKIPCSQCGGFFTWFSGNIANQLCEVCKIPIPTTPEEIVDLFATVGGRPDMIAVKKVQLRAIREFAARQLEEYASLADAHVVNPGDSEDEIRNYVLLKVKEHLQQMAKNIREGKYEVPIGQQSNTDNGSGSDPT